MGKVGDAVMLVHHNGHETEEWIDDFPTGENGKPCLLFRGAKVRLTLTKGSVWPAVIDEARHDFIVTCAEGGRRGVRFEKDEIAKLELGW